jgi:hypothetical protein
VQATRLPLQNQSKHEAGNFNQETQTVKEMEINQEARKTGKANRSINSYFPDSESAS